MRCVTIVSEAMPFTLPTSVTAFADTEENHSNEHASYKIPPLTNIFESPNILSLDSLFKEIAKNKLTNEKSPVTKSFPVKMVFLSDV